MNRKTMPLILMLIAGAITSIITFVKNYTIFEKLIALLIVLLVFYFLGSVLKWMLDFFDEQNEKKRIEEGEVIEKSDSDAVETESENEESNV